jgi:hypothetical protein
MWMVTLALLTVARSAVFVWWPQSQFDADQAVTGLMAKHVAELRAFPVFWYGQTYMLGVESWLAAPLFAVFGASVTALKIPLLAINVAIAVVLFRLLTREVGLGGWRAATATLFFVLAAPITAAHFVTANGGNVEPALYVLLLWILRRRPVWMGIVLGVGFLNREFTIYGAFAWLAIDLLRRTLFTREAARRYGVAFGSAAIVWLAFVGLRQVSSAAGPGTSVADIHSALAGNNLVQVAERLCMDPHAIASGAGRIFTVHWPELFGLESQALTDFGIESGVRQGLDGSAWLLVPVLGIPFVRILHQRFSRSTEHAAPSAPHPALRSEHFCLYLVLVALFSVAGYLVGRCGLIDFYTMRYELLSVLGAVGLSGWYLRIERSRPLLAVWGFCYAAVLAISVIAHGRLIAEYATNVPVAPKQELIEALDARGIKYGYTDYWTAYYVTFLSGERIILSPEDIVKVRTYTHLIDANRDAAVRIARRPCAGGEQLTAAFWSCKL